MGGFNRSNLSGAVRGCLSTRDWKGETSEKSERQTFWNEFFEVFGKKRRTLFVRVKRTSSYLPSMNSFGKRPPC